MYQTANKFAHGIEVPLENNSEPENNTTERTNSKQATPSKKKKKPHNSLEHQPDNANKETHTLQSSRDGDDFLNASTKPFHVITPVKDLQHTQEFICNTHKRLSATHTRESPVSSN